MKFFAANFMLCGKLLLLCAQLLKLLSVAGRATVLVSAATLSLMMKMQPALTRSHVVLPLTAPLRAITAGLLARAPSLPFC